ncbi:MAG: DDE-type integrase/transposase/recombinase [Nanoarchaeota archaeon]|nr:DDE-type integrase/transposase/recombinase [Nanoarchaeota archaeon]
MITNKAKHKTKVLMFWDKHGLEATLDAFPHKRSTIFLWKKKFKQGNNKPEALNDQKRTPKIKRRRIWPLEIRNEIKRIRDKENHPNLGPEKIYPLLKSFCKKNNLEYPQPRTIARIISDDPDKMRIYPQKVSHFGKIKKINRQKVLRKPKDLKPEYPGHLIALDTIEKRINGCKRYVITFEDIYTRFSFAWSTKSHASKAAKEFFDLCLKVFPYSFNLLHVLTDNGSEFKKHFTERLKELHLTHYHTYPKTPKMNAHIERFNRTIQDEFIDYFSYLLIDPDKFNQRLIDYLIFYNIDRVHHAFKNKLSPVQFMIQWQEKELLSNKQFKQQNYKQLNQSNQLVKIPVKSNYGWHYTICCVKIKFMLV